MKCNNCCFTFDNGTYEYPELCCKIFGDDTPDIFYKEEGCLLHFKEALKLANICDELDGLQYFRYNFIKNGENGPTFKKYEELNNEEKQIYDNYVNRQEKLSIEQKSYLKHLENKYKSRFVKEVLENGN